MRTKVHKKGYVLFYPIYEILTVELKNLKGHKKIKKDKKYELTINPYFEYDYVDKYKYPSQTIYARPMNIKGKHIGIFTNTWNIYTTPNIEGLYYISPAHSTIKPK
ncbi:MAG: hypothetical protein FWH36_09490 [Lentimicrobiaceae bacterium]|nr:hypothetical protein [Lentimicrobiaceae bacterium]